jgi:hypothetical protein
VIPFAWNSVREIQITVVANEFYMVDQKLYVVFVHLQWTHNNGIYVYLHVLVMFNVDRYGFSKFKIDVSVICEFFITLYNFFKSVKWNFVQMHFFKGRGWMQEVHSAHKVFKNLKSTYMEEKFHSWKMLGVKKKMALKSSWKNSK